VIEVVLYDAYRRGGEPSFFELPVEEQQRWADVLVEVRTYGLREYDAGYMSGYVAGVDVDDD
jgi:hypothetical protein